MEPDLLKRLALPGLAIVQGALGRGVPEPLRDTLTTFVDHSGLVVVALVCATFGRARAPRDVARACAVVAFGLAVWLLRHPSDRLDALVLRWDHLAFAGTAGFAIVVLGGRYRKAWLSGVSVLLLLVYVGPLALAVAAGMTAIGLLVIRTRLGTSLRVMIAAQALLVVAVYGFAFWLRSRDFAAAARVQGLLAFWSLRHVSLLVSAVRTGTPSLLDCGTFLTFYPGVMGLLGAAEVHSEFARRNLDRAPTVQHARAARRVIEGILMLTASHLIPVTLERLEASATVLEAWACAIAFFVRTALAVRGAWRVVAAAALFYGVQLRANFAGLLGCRNPTELWWSWRSTLTNWLVQHVYAPLGGNRRHQSRNIAAAFLVSFVWHVIGIPFLVPDFRPAHVVAVALWAAINGIAVIAHVNLAGRLLVRGPEPVPLRVRTGIATVLTWALGAMTPILLSYQGPAVARLPRLLRLLVGLGPGLGP